MKPFDKYIFFLIAGFILLLISSCYEPDVEEVLRPGAVIQDDKYYLGTSLSYASYLERNATDGQYFKNENGERESPFESVKNMVGILCVFLLLLAHIPATRPVMSLMLLIIMCSKG